MRGIRELLERYSEVGDDLGTALGLDEDSTADDLIAAAEWLESDDAADAIDSSAERYESDENPTGSWAVDLRVRGMAADLRALAANA